MIPVSLATRFVLGLIVSGVFAYAGLLKIGDLAAFHGDLRNYRILPEFALLPFSHLIPWMEVCLGLFFWVPGFRSASLRGIVLLLMAFSLALLQAGLRGLDIDCGCFGSTGPDTEIPWILVRNALLLAASCWLIKNLQPQKRN